MPIPFNRYVAITSGVGAGATVRRRDLIARLFTTASDIPTGTVMEFNSDTAVGEFFGTGTEEFRRAQFYFGFVSKISTRPQLISFARWADVQTTAMILGGPVTMTLAELQTITAGALSVTIGATTEALSGLDLSSASSFADVASILQTLIRTGTGTVFTDATVIFNAERNRFELTAGEAGENAISVAAGAANDAGAALSLLEARGARFSAGVEAAQSITDLITTSTELSNNFGSFAFIPTLSEAQKVEATTWNDARNVLFQFHTQVTDAEASSLSTAIIGMAGTGMTLNTDALSDEYPEMLPMAVLASTDYTRRASTQNYMFQFAELTATVTTNADANLYDPLRVNYYGQTQTAGQLREFYQRGTLTGGPTDPVDMNTYANEQWLKDDAGVRIMNLLLALPKVSANQSGRAQLLAVIQATIDLALFNGSISTGRTLTDVQRIFITEQTGDELAHYQVATSGYWVDAEIESYTTSDNRTEFRANYTLIYTKDDVIRMVQGTHTLI